MPHHETITITGTVADIFAHRFVVETSTGRILADLTPKGAEMIALRTGDRVTLTGEMKPSELKVTCYVKDGSQAIIIEQKAPPHEGDADPLMAIREAESRGYVIQARPRRKPKHFEILGRSRDGELHELHIEIDGQFRKAKPGDAADPKWVTALANGANVASLEI